jgi:hypothetical protein
VADDVLGGAPALAVEPQLGQAVREWPSSQIRSKIT